jgi:thiol-disulfide isomerase/thioredoxin
MTALAYSTISDPPLHNNPKDRSANNAFADRMRQLVLTKPTTKPSSSSTKHVTTITSLAAYKQHVGEGNKEGQITVVRFYADYCRACRAMTPAFYRLAQGYVADGDDTNDISSSTRPSPQKAAVQFGQVPVTAETNAIHQGLQVPSVPFGHVYHPTAGLVEEVKLRPSRVADFAKILESYVAGSCALPAEPDASSGIYKAPYVRET